MCVTERTELDYWVHGNYRPWYNDEFLTVKSWVEENINGPYTLEEDWNWSDIGDDDEFKGAMLHFHSREDAAYFKLVWVKV